MTELPTGQELRDRARKLGVDTQGESIFASSVGRHEYAPDYEDNGV